MEGKEVEPRLKKGFWKPEEDLVLKKYVESHGEGNWGVASKKSGLMRGAKSCRLRWKNYLRPNIKRGMMSEDEKDLILRLHKLLGNRWSLIAGRLPGRTDNEVKNYWNTHLNKRPSRAQIRETPVEEEKQPTTNLQGEDIATTAADSWIQQLKNGDYYGINMLQQDYSMPFFDDFIYSASLHWPHCMDDNHIITREERIFNFCSFTD